MIEYLIYMGLTAFVLLLWIMVFVVACLAWDAVTKEKKK